MPSNIGEYQRFINTVAADTEVVKLVLGGLLMILTQTHGAQIIDDLHAAVKRATQRNAPDEEGGQLAKRLHELTLSQVDEFFRRLHEGLGRLTPPSGPAN